MYCKTKAIYIQQNIKIIPYATDMYQHFILFYKNYKLLKYTIVTVKDHNKKNLRPDYYNNIIAEDAYRLVVYLNTIYQYNRYTNTHNITSCNAHLCMYIMLYTILVMFIYYILCSYSGYSHQLHVSVL